MDKNNLKENNPVIANPTETENLKETELVTATNVTEMMKQYIMPKLYLIFGVLSGIIIMIITVVWMLFKRPNIACDELGHGPNGKHLLANIITKQEF